MKDKIIKMLNEQIEEYLNGIACGIMGPHAKYCIAGVERAIWIITHKVGETE